MARPAQGHHPIMNPARTQRLASRQIESYPLVAMYHASLHTDLQPTSHPLTLVVRSTESSGITDTVTFQQSCISIGRGEANDLALVDARKTVSRQHAQVQFDGTFHLIDLGSTNATYLNDQRLQIRQPYPLQMGDTFRIGAFTLECRADQPALAEEDIDAGGDTTTTLVFPLATEAPHVEPKPAPASPDKLSEQLARLNQLALEINTAHDLPTIVDRIVQHAVEAVQARQGVITLLDACNSTQTLARLHEKGDLPFHANMCLMGWMTVHQKPLLINDLQQDDRFSGMADDLSVRSILCVPLMVRSRLIGILTVCDKRHEAGFTEADQRLLGIMAGQSSQVIENARLAEEEQRLQQVQRDMQSAYEMQVNLLPKQAPHLTGYDIAGTSLPAQVVGGDYYDFIPVSDQSLACCVGDVAGKGLPASLLMANVQATVRTHAQWSTAAHTCLEETNNLLWKNTGRGVFVTLCYGLLDAAQHRFRYANAGHNRPLLFRKDARPRRLETAGLAIGCVPTWSYEEATVAVEIDDLLVIYSDGITEAMNRAREEFGEERLSAVISANHEESAATIIDRVLGAVAAFTGEAPQSDDMTLMIIKRHS